MSAVLLPYQIRFLNDPAPVKICIKARRIGLSMTSRCWALQKALTTPGHRIFYLSRDQRSAETWLADLAKMAMALNIISPGYFLGGRNVTATRLRFPNGSQIFAFPSSAEALTGNGGSVIIDEAATHSDLPAVLRAAVPVTQWGAGELLIFSTPREGFFMEIIARAERGEFGRASVHRVTIHDAIADGLLDRLNESWRANGKPEKDAPQFLADCRAELGSDILFSQEYETIPAPAQGSKAISEDEWNEISAPLSTCYAAPVTGGKYYCGLDIGRQRDQTVAVILELVGAELILRDMVRIENPTPFHEQEKRLTDFFRRWRVRDGVADGTTVGQHLAENMARAVRGLRVVKWTSVTRPQMIGALMDAILARRIRLPQDAALKEDFLSVSVYANKISGQPDYWIPSRGGLGHGDAFCAVAMAVAAAQEDLRRAGIVKTPTKAEEETAKRSRWAVARRY